MRFLQFLLVLLFAIELDAQNDFYQDDHIPEIRIYFSDPDWQDQLNDLYTSGLEERMICSIEIDGTALDSVGIRYKGYSSVSVDYVKNPFNIKLDFIHQNQNYQGKDKIKLSNVIHDPSFLREVLSYEIARKYMPAGRANYAAVYINDVYWGLYTNVKQSIKNSWSIISTLLKIHFSNAIRKNLIFLEKTLI